MTNTKKPAAKKAKASENTLKIKVDKQVLKDNPELAQEGVEIGETIEVPKEAISNSEELKSETPVKPEQAKPKKEKVDPVKLEEFNRLALGKIHNKITINDLAKSMFGDDAVLHETQNPREIFFTIKGKKYPENGYFCISMI